MSGITVKICGVRRPEDALVAADAGADYVGMAFVPGVRRYIDSAAARAITDPLRARGANAPRCVGLFADQPLADVLDTIAVAGLDLAQLCADEPLEYCRRVQEHAAVIKVLHVSNDDAEDTLSSVARQIDAYSEAGCIVTLDSQVDGRPGGTGQSFDWTIAGRLAEGGRKFLLAGGLTPDNVAEAVAVARPWGVDVSSGVETAGEKDAAKIRSFVSNARGGH